MRKVFAIILMAVVLFSFTGCFGMFNRTQNPIWLYDYSGLRLVQLEPPQPGQPIITVYTSHGEFTAMLFPEYAPNTVENFMTRVEEGFYNDKPVFGLVTDMYFLSGAYDEDGQQGVTKDGRLIPNENSVNLWPFKGSLMAFSGRQGFGDSRFLVCGSEEVTAAGVEELKSATRPDGTQLLPDELLTAFRENECMLGLMGAFTIFGQVIDGMDTIDVILALNTDDRNRPTDEIYIERIELSEWSE